MAEATSQARSDASVAEEADRHAIEAFRRGDRRAFEALVRRHQQAVRSVAMRFARDADTADELAQRAFVQALRHVGDLRGAFRPWLLRIVVNLSRNHVRDHARFVDETAGEAATDPRLDESIDEARRRDRVRRALAELGERQREVVMLRIDAQLSFAEVAEALEITENNAKVTYHHAVRRLRELVGGTDV